MNKSSYSNNSSYKKRLNGAPAPTNGKSARWTKFFRFFKDAYEAMFFGGVIQVRPLQPPFSHPINQLNQEVKLTGNDIATLEQAQFLLNQQINSGEETIPFDGLEHPEKGYFINVGKSRSGKTLFLKLSLIACLKRFHGNSFRQAIVFDPEGDLLKLIQGFNEKYCKDRPLTIRILNPWDTRTIGWDILRDVRTFGQALTLAQICFIKDESHAESAGTHFSEAAASVLGGVIYALSKERTMNPPQGFSLSLRHVLLVLRNKVLLKKYLKSTPITETLWDNFLAQANSDLLATIERKASRLVEIGELLNDKEGLSLKDFALTGNNEILVVGGDSLSEESSKMFSAFAIQTYLRFALTVENETTDRRYFFADEFQELSTMPILIRVFTRGLKRGIRTFLCCQSLGQILKNFGEEDTRLIIEQAGEIGFFGLSGKSAKDAEEALGVERVLFPQKSISTNLMRALDANVSIQQTVLERPLVSSDKFSAPKADLKQGVRLVGFIPSIKSAVIQHFAGSYFEETLMAPSGDPQALKTLIKRDQISGFGTTSRHSHVDEDECDLKPLSEDEKKYFGIEKDNAPSNKPDRSRPIISDEEYKRLQAVVSRMLKVEESDSKEPETPDPNKPRWKVVWDDQQEGDLNETKKRKN